MTTSREPSGDHSKSLDAARQVGQPARLAAIERQEVDLPAVLALARVAGPVRLLLDEQPPIREERERPAVRREPGMAVVTGAERQLSGFAGVLAGRDEPERSAVAVVVGRDGLQRDDHEAAVRREARIGRDAQAVQVVRARRTGHGPFSTGRVAGDDAKSSGLPSSARCPTSSRCGSRPTALPDLPGPAADAAAAAAGAVRFRGAPLRAVVGRGPGTGPDRAGRRAWATARCGSWMPRGSTCQRHSPSWPAWPCAWRPARRSSTASSSSSMPSGARIPRRLTARLAGGDGRPAAFLAFDLLHLDGRSLLG